MNHIKEFDVVIIGGSYAGLSAAMALGRSLRKVLIIDNGKPCNRQTPHSHNFITQDGATPKEIFNKAKEQVLQYPTVKFLKDLAVSATKTTNGFEIFTEAKKKFIAKKILFATGVKDIMPNLKGFNECWGVSVLHCPYCHGYEVANKKLGIIANGDTALELCNLIQNWTDKLTLFTNGKSELTQDQRNYISKLKIDIVEKEIQELDHTNGNIESLIFNDGSMTKIEAIFSRVPFEQHSKIPIELGCKTAESGHIEVEFSQKTNIEGVFCAGDNTTPFRAVSISTASGTKAGAFINMELINEILPKYNVTHDS
ncbi:thioredoxin reductase [Mesonia algae]|uniref:Thioredoxin reductase n=1 Tax=Mesonia algae TaxID=213248 RepID=A0A2W7K4L5_9FLAO|nr:NAD(P)/FAD-dependent oxidoreductase [Mesonia algae]PZW42450.1 thioredoxin reductase [Mesonia algae]